MKGKKAWVIKNKDGEYFVSLNGNEMNTSANVLDAYDFYYKEDAYKLAFELGGAYWNAVAVIITVKETKDES